MFTIKITDIINDEKYGICFILNDKSRCFAEIVRDDEIALPHFEIYPEDDYETLENLSQRDSDNLHKLLEDTWRQQEELSWLDFLWQKIY